MTCKKNFQGREKKRRQIWGGQTQRALFGCFRLAAGKPQGSPRPGGMCLGAWGVYWPEFEQLSTVFWSLMNGAAAVVVAPRLDVAARHRHSALVGSVRSSHHPATTTGDRHRPSEPHEAREPAVLIPTALGPKENNTADPTPQHGRHQHGQHTQRTRGFLPASSPVPCAVCGLRCLLQRTARERRAGRCGRERGTPAQARFPWCCGVKRRRFGASLPRG